MPPEVNTLEEARAEIVRLTEELATRTTERDNYSTQLTETNNELERVRTINQEYYLKIRAQHEEPDEDDEPEDVPSCEDFARTLTI